MIELWILRHAKAVATDLGGDHGRPLAPRGRRQAKAVASHFAALRASGSVTPSTVLSSSAVRAAATATLVMAGLADDARLFIDKGLYSADVDDVVMRLRVEEGGAPLLVVGHNPVLHELALMLLAPDDTSGRSRLEQGFPTSALATVSVDAADWSQLSFGQGHLVDVFVPSR